MRAYWAIVNARFRMLLQYRAAAVAGFGTQLFWGLIRVMIFDAFYRSTSSLQPMSYPDVVTYVWLGQAMLAMLPWNVDTEIRSMIRSGTVAYELLRPLDLYALWFSRALAMRTAPTILRAVPMLMIAGLFFGFRLPPSWASAGAWVAATFGALLLSCAITTLLNISLLWTISGEGVSQLVFAGVIVLSGMIVPLPLFPDWAQAVLDFLPFRGLVDIPFRVYVGHIPPGKVAPALAHQMAWTVALVVLGRLVLARGMRRLVIQGG
ncbi:MAG: ABC transporter permease [bacterium]